MYRRHSGSPRSIALVASVIATLSAGGCAQLMPMDSAHAVANVRRSVCGQPQGRNEQSCMVHGDRRIRGGYQVVITRRPPAGNDHLLVTIRGGRIDIEPITGRAQ